MLKSIKLKKLWRYDKIIHESYITILKVKILSKHTHGPGSIDLTPRTFRADGQYTTDRTVVFREEEDRRYTDV